MDKAKLERLQMRTEVCRHDVSCGSPCTAWPCAGPPTLHSPTTYTPLILRPLQKRTQLKADLGVDDRWGVEPSSSDGAGPQLTCPCPTILCVLTGERPTCPYPTTVCVLTG